MAFLWPFGPKNIEKVLPFIGNKIFTLLSLIDITFSKGLFTVIHKWLMSELNAYLILAFFTTQKLLNDSGIRIHFLCTFVTEHRTCFTRMTKTINTIKCRHGRHDTERMDNQGPKDEGVKKGRAIWCWLCDFIISP